MNTTASIQIQSFESTDLDHLQALLSAVKLPDAGLGAEGTETFGVVALDGDQIVGSALVERYGASGLLRSVAVDPSMQGRGLGIRLARAVLDRADAAGLECVYLLTETAESFFPRFGFRVVERSEVPQSVRQSVEFSSACPESATVMLRPRWGKDALPRGRAPQ